MSQIQSGHPANMWHCLPLPVSVAGWLQTADRREINLDLIIKQLINGCWTTACQLASARLYFAY